MSIEIADGVADVRLARPEKLNALDGPMFEAIDAALTRLARERAVRCVVLSGEGRGFCAGLDMAAMAAGGMALDLLARTGEANLAQQAAWGWRTLPMPVVAAVHGVAIGAGLQIASGADVRIVHPATRLAIRETFWGLVPDMAGFVLWRDLVRGDVLRELAFTAREFDGAAAAAWGFATRLDEEPRQAAFALAREIAGRSPDAVRAAKRLLNGAADGQAGTMLMQESAEQSALIGTANQREAAAAGLARRAPRFSD